MIANPINLAKQIALRLIFIDHYLVTVNRDNMWDVDSNPNGDYGWTGPTFVYANQISGYTEAELESILAQVVDCETKDGFGCGISDDDLTAAMEYTQFYKNGSEILCTTYLKTNLVYDLQTNDQGVTGYTDVFFGDWRAEEAEDFNDVYLFDRRYYTFQTYTSDSYPGVTVNPIMVDIMFQIVTINERKTYC